MEYPYMTSNEKIEFLKNILATSGYNLDSSETTKRIFDSVEIGYKRMDDAGYDFKQCETNDHKCQFVAHIKKFDIPSDGESIVSMEIEVCQENTIGWLNFCYYLSGNDVMEFTNDKLKQIEDSLVRAWNAT